MRTLTQTDLAFVGGGYNEAVKPDVETSESTKKQEGSTSSNSTCYAEMNGQVMPA